MTEALYKCIAFGFVSDLLAGLGKDCFVIFFINFSFGCCHGLLSTSFVFLHQWLSCFHLICTWRYEFLCEGLCARVEHLREYMCRGFGLNIHDQ